MESDCDHDHHPRTCVITCCLAETGLAFFVFACGMQTDEERLASGWREAAGENSWALGQQHSDSGWQGMAGCEHDGADNLLRGGTAGGGSAENRSAGARS